MEHLGPDTVAVLDGPGALDALVRVPRIGRAKAATIKADWDAKKGMHWWWVVMVFDALWKRAELLSQHP